MTLPDHQQQQLLERLLQAGTRPLTFAELRHDGIQFPATVVGELEMQGYRIERVHKNGRMGGVRLIDSGSSDAARPSAARRRWGLPSRDHA